MAGFKTHVTVSATLGAAAGFCGYWYGNLDWGPICLAAGLTTLGGMLPDLDSDSGVPIRELFGLAGAFLAVLLLHRLRRSAFSQDQLVVILMGTYLLVRLFLAGGVMLGFLSHLALDELYAVDLRGLVPRLNKAAGSALKLFGPSWSANVLTYALLFILAG